MKSRIFFKLLAAFLIVIVAATVTLNFTVRRVWENSLDDEIERDLTQKTLMFAERVQNDGKTPLQEIASEEGQVAGARATIIDHEGKVLADSEAGNAHLHSQAEEILTAGTRAAELVSQLLSFSRRQLTQPKPLEINKVVQCAWRIRFGKRRLPPARSVALFCWEPVWPCWLLLFLRGLPPNPPPVVCSGSSSSPRTSLQETCRHALLNPLPTKLAMLPPHWTKLAVVWN